MKPVNAETVAAEVARLELAEREFGLTINAQLVLAMLRKLLAYERASQQPVEPAGLFYEASPGEWHQGSANGSQLYLKPLYAAPPMRLPQSWEDLQKVTDAEAVDHALYELVEDSTNDNAVRVVQAVVSEIKRLNAITIEVEVPRG